MREGLGQESYQWTLPDIEAPDVMVNITVIDTGGERGWDESGPFTITAAPSSFLSQYGWPLLLLIVAVALVLCVVAWKRRTPREGEAPPPETQGPPTPPSTWRFRTKNT